jgi:hypothetical protein
LNLLMILDEYNVRNLHDGKAVCPFKGLGRYPDPVAAWIPSQDSVSAMGAPLLL